MPPAVTQVKQVVLSVNLANGQTISSPLEVWIAAIIASMPDVQKEAVFKFVSEINKSPAIQPIGQLSRVPIISNG